MSKTYYIKSGNDWSVTDKANIDIHDHLPAHTYVALFHPEKGFYLSQVEPMAIPQKIYGSVAAHADRIYQTFSTRTRNTGVLLNGEKGAGKTLTLAKLAHTFMENKLPVVIINSPFHGDGFNKFISEISQPCMIAFDEFDKTYDDEQQTRILTLLDGVFNSSKLFVLTCNDSYKVNSFMLNRPGRIFYNLKYSGMEDAAIRGYCEDALENKSNIEGLLAVAATIDKFNFDMLKALVEEMNRYNETAKESIGLLNIRPARAPDITYKYIVSRDGNVLYTHELHNSINIFSGKNFQVYMEYANPNFNPNLTDEEKNEQIMKGLDDENPLNTMYETLSYNLILSFKDVKKMDSSGYIFEKEGYVVHIFKESESMMSYSDYF